MYLTWRKSEMLQKDEEPALFSMASVKHKARAFTILQIPNGWKLVISQLKSQRIFIIVEMFLVWCVVKYHYAKPQPKL